MVGSRRGEEALEAVERERPDMVILDVWLPDVDGYDVLRQLRSFSDVPAMVLSCKPGTAEKVRAFDLGADDYVGKPFDSRELVARAGAILRRLELAVPPRRTETFRSDGLEIDFAAEDVRVQGRRVDLTRTEYRLLYHLARNSGRILPREALIARVWGPGHEGAIDELRVFIGRLRDKLGDHPSAPRYIRTERGLGYGFIAASGSEQAS